MRATGRLLSTAVVAAGMSAILFGGGLAQDATPTAMQGATPTTMEEGEDTFLAHLHPGTCEAPSGDPVAVLAELAPPEWVGMLTGGEATEATDLPFDAGEFGNAPIPVSVSTTEVELPIADIVGGMHAITVERSDPADPEDAVACGNIGGVVDENGDLFIGLEEENGSGHYGVVWLHDTGASTTVVVFLAHPDERDAIETALAGMQEMATPMATPVGEAMATPETGEATPTA
jgi:hypothetical protein